MEYEIHRSKRKTLAMSITKDLKVKIRAPYRMPEREIVSFIEKHIDWISKHKELMRKKLDSPMYQEFTENEVKEYKRKARIVLSERVAYYSKIMRVQPTGIKITSATTRWGSCSRKNGLCFTYRLILYPIEAIDYIVVHELAHIKVKNHSSDFYDLVKKYMPDYKEREALLK